MKLPTTDLPEGIMEAKIKFGRQHSYKKYFKLEGVCKHLHIP